MDLVSLITKTKTIGVRSAMTDRQTDRHETLGFYIINTFFTTKVLNILLICKVLDFFSSFSVLFNAFDIFL